MSDESKSTTLGERIKEVREEQGISVEDAATKAGMDAATWSGIEDGSRSLKIRTIWVIANVLGVRPSNLFV